MRPEVTPISVNNGRFFVFFLFWFVGELTLAQTTPLSNPSIAIHNQDMVEMKQAKVIDYIWSTNGWPTGRLPYRIDTNVYDTQYAVLQDDEGNLLRIDRYVIGQRHDFRSTVYHFHPIKSNGKLFVYHAGHGYGFPWEDKYINGDGEGPGYIIPELLKEGYSVLALSMPLQGNNLPKEELTGIGFVDWVMYSSYGHIQMFQYLDNPYTFFFDPLTISLNYVDDHYSYSKIYMTGLSGGGWTTTFYSALDRRIDLSFPVAGSVPLSLRVGYEGTGDAEQGEDYNGVLGVANYMELYVLGAAGPGRGQLQILNRFDNCCFYGNTRYLEWVDSVKIRLKTLGDDGQYNFFLDESHKTHKISPIALEEMRKFIAYHEQFGSSYLLSEPEVRTICPGEATKLSVLTSQPNLHFQWQLNKNDGNGFIDIPHDSIHEGTTSGTLLIKRASIQLHGYNYRCMVSGDHVPTTTSFTTTLHISGALSIVQDVADANVCPGGTASLQIIADGDDLRYRWQEDNGAGFRDIINGDGYDGANSEKLIIKDNSETRPHSRYRCIISNFCGTEVESSIARVIENLATEVLSMSRMVTACENETVSVDIGVVGTQVQYLWQYGDANGFSDIQEGDPFSGSSSERLTLYGASLGMNGSFFRCIVTGTCGSVTTDPILLKVMAPTKITEQPQDVVACEDDDISFSVEVEGSDLSYQWRVNNGDGFVDVQDDSFYSGTNTKKLAVLKVRPEIDRQFYVCDIYSTCSDRISSKEVALSVSNSTELEFVGLKNVFCRTDLSISLKASPSGGFFSGRGVKGERFYPYMLEPGADTIRYAYLSGDGCQTTIEKVVTIKACKVEEAMAGVFLIYPNPPRAILNLELEIANETDLTLHVVNFQGRTVLRRNLEVSAGKHAFNIDVRNLSAGVYNVLLFTPSITLGVKRFVIK